MNALAQKQFEAARDHSLAYWLSVRGKPITSWEDVPDDGGCAFCRIFIPELSCDDCPVADLIGGVVRPHPSWEAPTEIAIRTLESLRE